MSEEDIIAFTAANLVDEFTDVEQIVSTDRELQKGKKKALPDMNLKTHTHTCIFTAHSQQGRAWRCAGWAELTGDQWDGTRFVGSLTSSYSADRACGPRSGYRGDAHTAHTGASRRPLNCLMGKHVVRNHKSPSVFIIQIIFFACCGLCAEMLLWLCDRFINLLVSTLKSFSFLLQKAAESFSTLIQKNNAATGNWRKGKERVEPFPCFWDEINVFPA